jgi:hypothetical protein
MDISLTSSHGLSILVVGLKLILRKESKMEVGEMVTIAQEIGAFKPVVNKVLEGLKDYKNEYRQIADFLLAEAVSARSKLFKGFVAEGFSREEAMTLTVATVQEMVKAVNSVKKVK